MASVDCYRHIEPLSTTRGQQVHDLVLQVTATKDDMALDEVMQLKERCVKHLLDSGIQRAELFDGGKNLTRPWCRKKNIGKEASAKVIIQTGDIERLSQAVHWIEHVKNSQREAIQMMMRSPVFSTERSLGAVAGGAASAGKQEFTRLDLESPKRTLWTCYKVRFALKVS